MKNIILGILGCMIAVYTIVSCLSIYSISKEKMKWKTVFRRYLNII